MKQLLSALLSGLVFGLGLSISQMTNPEKVKGFLDLFGNWDPSLALVMASALTVTGIGYRLVLRREKPAFDQSFNVPTNKSIDKPLATGAVLFGIGWGLAGLCPGPAVAGLSLGHASTYVFVVSMVVGMIAYQWTERPRQHDC